MPITRAAETDPKGTSIFVRSWTPTGRPAARILLVHGIAEHSGRYDATGQRLAAAGLDVRAFDLPGFGGSGGRRAYVERWDDYLEVVAAQLRALAVGGPTPAPPAPATPVVLFGHSMGATIALTYVLGAAAASRPMPDLLVVTGPPIGRPPLPVATRLAAPVLARLLPTLELSNGLHREQLSRDPSVGESYLADPLVHPRTTARLGHELFKAMALADRELSRRARLPIPTLAVHGADDSIASPAACGSLRTIGNCEYRLLPGLRHEVLHEPEGPAVIEQIAGWIRSNVDTLGISAAASPEASAAPASRGAAATAAGR